MTSTQWRSSALDIRAGRRTRMRPSTTDACTVLRRRALRTTSTSMRGAARPADVKSSSSWSKRIRHAAPQI